MRRKFTFLIALAAVLASPIAANAQQTTRRVKVEVNQFQVGFTLLNSSISDGFKTGLWAPVLVRFVDDEKSPIRLPVAVDGSISGEILVESPDNDGASSTYPQKFTIGANEPLQVLTYCKPSGSGGELKITVKAGGQTHLAASKSLNGIDVGQYLYLALGDKLADLDASLLKFAGIQNNNMGSYRPLHAAYENNTQNLPKLWFGYEPVDLAILSTNNGKFVDSLVGDRQGSPQLMALAEWVRRGGKLVVSITPTNREKVQRLLSSGAWQPNLPPLLPLDSKLVSLESLDSLVNWSNTGRAWVGAFQPKLDLEGNPKVRNGVLLESTPAVNVLCNGWVENKPIPLIVRCPHGMGSVTLVAFDFNDWFINEWPGRFDFWQAVVEKLAGTKGNRIDLNMNPRGAWDQFGSGTDISTHLWDELEKFDTPTISFGWVVLFILIYIIVVGPVDYFILKVVFKRLELTWLTFPTVVLTVSLLAYFTAYAIKGQDLKVNKVDLVDIDLRSSLNADFQPAAATAYGTSWFSILSPRIQNYTIGIEPMMHNWQSGIATRSEKITPTMSWFGRPEFRGFASSGRGRSPSLFSRAYSYEPEAIGLRDVPIPVWTTRSFTASWVASFEKSILPVESKLTYADGSVNTLSGVLKNNLPFTLREAGLVCREHFYPLADLPSGGTAKITLDSKSAKQLNTWFTALPGQALMFDADNFPSGGLFNPAWIVKDLMFNEKAKSAGISRNHAHRLLDWSWRIEPLSDQNDSPVESIVLVARLSPAHGTIDKLQNSSDAKLPSRLWLGESPASQGMLAQETFIRIILPVAPKRTP